jgi:hypothetical protein
MSVSTGNENTQIGFNPCGTVESRETHEDARAARLARVGDGLRRKREARGSAFRFGNVRVRLSHRIVTDFANRAGEA